MLPPHAFHDALLVLPPHAFHDALLVLPPHAFHDALLVPPPHAIHDARSIPHCIGIAPLTFDGCSIAIGILPFPCSFPPLHRPIDAVRSGSIDRVHDDSSDDTHSIPSSRRYANHKEYLWYLCYHVNRNGVPPLLSEVRSRDDDAALSHTDPVSSQLRSHDGRAPSENCSNEDDYSTWGMWFTFFILYCNFIPISLYVTIEIVNYGQVASFGARRAAPHCSFGWCVERTARVVPQCWWCGLRPLLGAVHWFLFCVRWSASRSRRLLLRQTGVNTRAVWEAPPGHAFFFTTEGNVRSRLADPRSASPSPRRPRRRSDPRHVARPSSSTATSRCTTPSPTPPRSRARATWAPTSARWAGV